MFKRICCHFGWHKWVNWGQPIETKAGGIVQYRKQSRHCEWCNMIEERLVL